MAFTRHGAHFGIDAVAPSVALLLVVFLSQDFVVVGVDDHFHVGKTAVANFDCVPVANFM